MTDHVPFRERLTCTIATAAEASGISRRKLYSMIQVGELETVKIGRRRLVKVASLIALLDSPSREAIDRKQSSSGLERELTSLLALLSPPDQNGGGRKGSV